MVSFREVPVTDPAAHVLLEEYFEARALGFPPSMGTYVTNFPKPEQFVKPGGDFVVVEDVGPTGEPAAVGCGGVRTLAPEKSGLARFEIKHVFLQPHVRGRGFGKVLLVELERRAAELGARELVLDTNASLEAAAGLYRSNGYVEIERFNDNPNATHWYGKRL